MSNLRKREKTNGLVGATNRGRGGQHKEKSENVLLVVGKNRGLNRPT